LLAALFLVLPFGPMLTWRVGDLSDALRRLAPAGALALLTLCIALALSGWRAIPAIGLALGVWLIAGGLIYLWTRLQRGEGASLAKAAVLPLAVWSMTLAHIGAGVMTIGAIAETSFRSERALAMAPGQGVDFAGRRITLVSVDEREGPNYSAMHGAFRIDDGGGAHALTAERRFYPTSPMPTTEVGIRSGLDGDIYIALGEPVRERPGAFAVRLYHNPMLYYIFLGALMMGLGGLLSLIALMRRRRAQP
jgi:cytochrome c-type biogenesis protein CcmF